ncbi:hypothetical protein [Winogradskyella immobilis]|uniref:Uncharacterized protein n=1 Tax=Winogradskyella immobilis TaxID=2816852 RepID=A0ABS8EPC0_9FLAO|nr:hypothetical protein [Winogradskyella immobilis]MCC1484851.1 hypothetical protein [Winogradskyella immobilis]MCG0016943.1 hypothetical protein [Winogradskyella immobilis]
MNLEKKNIERRKNAPLTNKEALLFFFLPTNFASFDNSKSTDFNESELKRFKTHGFYLKYKQARELQFYGRIFYVALSIIISYFILF